MRFSVRRTDRRSFIAGFVGLLGIMMAHSLMETARDALFLASLPATDLPWAYLAIALIAIVELEVHARVMRKIRDRRALLATSLLTGSVVTLGFWASLERLGAWAPFGFYVWTGLLITIVLIEFWLLLGDAVTVTEAKRVFPGVAAGGVTGALLGSLSAETLLRWTDPSGLVVTASIVLAATACTPFLWRSRVSEPAPTETDDRDASVRWLVGDRYLSRILLLVLIGTITVTVVDYAFKSTVATHIPSEGLAPFFARFYLGLNSVALVVQLVGAGWLLRGFGPHRSSSLLPVLLLGGTMGLVAGPILPFAVALKAFDGTLRHTLYRGAVEVLYLPLESRRREKAKGLIEVFGHRVGQAIASVLIMTSVAFGFTTRQIGMALVVSIASWLVTIRSTRRQYVDEFRSRLKRGLTDTQTDLVGSDRQSYETIRRRLRDHLLRLIAVLQCRAAIEHDQTPDAVLLRAALRDAERATLERAFELMGLWYPDENFALVWQGLRSENGGLHGASVEVLEATLTGSVREAVVALIDESEPPEKRARLAAAALGEPVRPMSQQDALHAAIDAKSLDYFPS